KHAEVGQPFLGEMAEAPAERGDAVEADDEWALAPLPQVEAHALLELGRLELDRHVPFERLRDGAVLLRRLGRLAEAVVVRVLCLSLHPQADRRDAEARVGAVEG